jgi:type IX secretion system PorP/SprF family membrane protein
MKKIIITACFLITMASGYAQDIHFTQFYETGALLNPAFAGLGEEKIRVGLSYRDQWAALDKTYKTGLFHADAPLLGGKNRSANIGLGGYAFFDRAGAGSLKQTEAALQLSGMAQVGDGHWISAGVRTAYCQFTGDNGDFTWGMQFDGTGYNASLNSFETFGQMKSNAFDISGGLAYSYTSSSNAVARGGKNSFTAGVAYHHIATPKVGFYDNAAEIPARIVAMLHGRFDFGTSKYGIIPVAYYSLQGKQQEANLGALFRYGLGTDSKYTGFLSESEIGAGMMFRVGDAIIPTIRFQTAHMVFGFSYDFTISKLSSAVRGNGGFEVSVRLRNIGGMGGTMGRSMM